MVSASFETILKNVRNCRQCEHFLPLGPRPIIHGNVNASLLIISQAPGTKAHLTGQSFNDASGERLRYWLDIDRETFYDSNKVAIMPMGLCYPGRLPKGGDLPPSAGCSERWHPVVRPLLKNIRLTLLVGGYAQQHYLKQNMKATVHKTVYCWKEYAPDFFPLPHPSWRTTNWYSIHPWFETTVLPVLRQKIKNILRLKN